VKSDCDSKKTSKDERNAQAIDRACKALQIVLLNAMKEGEFHGEWGVIVTGNSGVFSRMRKVIDESEKF